MSSRLRLGPAATERRPIPIGNTPLHPGGSSRQGRAPKPPTIREVARHAGVSLGTVSRVLHSHASVGEDVRERVLRAVRELDYHPDFVARSMRTGATHTVGCIITDISNPLFADIIQAAERELRLAGYSMIVANSMGDPDEELSLVRALLARRVDGLILASPERSLEETRELLRTAGIPIVLLDREMDVAGDQVLTDHEAGLVEATEYLLALGHTRIGLVCGPVGVRPGYTRLRGFRSAMQRAGLDPEPFIRTGSFSPQEGLRLAIDLLKSPQRPSALIAGSNQLLEGVLRATRTLGLEIPGDLSLIGCDDTPLSELSLPPITVVARNIPEIGRSATRLFLDRRAASATDADHPRVLTLGTSLVIRQSCMAFRTPGA